MGGGGVLPEAAAPAAPGVTMNRAPQGRPGVQSCPRGRRVSPPPRPLAPRRVATGGSLLQPPTPSRSRTCSRAGSCGGGRGTQASVRLPSPEGSHGAPGPAPRAGRQPGPPGGLVSAPCLGQRLRFVHKPAWPLRGPGKGDLPSAPLQGLQQGPGEERGRLRAHRHDQPGDPAGAGRDPAAEGHRRAREAEVPGEPPAAPGQTRPQGRRGPAGPSGPSRPCVSLLPDGT